MSVIKVENLSFSYVPNVPILKNISLTIDHKPTAIIGQNGSGKTTLVKLLKGLLRPTSGNIWINGHNTKTLTVAQLASHIGLVFQNPNDQIFKNTVLEEVLFGPLNIGTDPKIAQTHAKESLELVGLSHIAHKNPYDLGLSERKLITIASILAMDTDIIIFDEPTIAQDFKSIEKIKNVINVLRRRGKTVLTIIHDMDFVAECFERTIVLAKGEVLLDGSIQDVFMNEDLLQKASLDLPHVIKLCKHLNYPTNYITPEAFIKAYSSAK